MSSWAPLGRSAGNPTKGGIPAPRTDTRRWTAPALRLEFWSKKGNNRPAPCRWDGKSLAPGPPVPDTTLRCQAFSSVSRPRNLEGPVPGPADKGMYFIWDFTQLNVRPHSRVGLLKYKTAPICSLSGPLRHSGVGRNPGAVGPVRSYNLNFTYPCQPWTRDRPHRIDPCSPNGRPCRTDSEGLSLALPMGVCDGRLRGTYPRRTVRFARHPYPRRFPSPRTKSRYKVAIRTGRRSRRSLPFSDSVAERSTCFSIFTLRLERTNISGCLIMPVAELPNSGSPSAYPTRSGHPQVTDRTLTISTQYPPAR